MPPDETEIKTPKGERTRARILEAALELFVTRGYEGASMRVIAEAAGVSVGNAYYYFASKEHLIQGFYARMHKDHQAVCEPVLERETALKDRLAGVNHAFFDVAAPYHQFAGALFKTAADPRSPLNPFSEASAPTRDEAIALMARIVEGSRTRVPKDIAGELPTLLWLHHMGLTLYWIHDDSEGCSRTRKLVDSSVTLVTRAIGLSKLPLMKPVRRAALRLLADLKP